MKRIARRDGIAALLLAAAVALVYANSLGNAFQYDDRHAIVENPHIRSLANLPGFLIRPEQFSRDPDKAMYRPLVLASLALNHAWSGYRVYSYHLVNVGLHALCSLLLWRCLRQLGRSADLALGGALLFALHPVASEPVNYVSSRSELLAAASVLAGCWLHRRRLGSGRGTAGAAAVTAYLAGLLSKATAVVLPVLLVLRDLLTDGMAPKWWRRYVPYAVLACLYMIYQLFVGGFLAKAVVSHPVRSYDAQLGTQIKAVPYYLKLLVLPSALSVDHAFSESSLGSAIALVALALVASIGALAIAARRWRASALLGVGWALVCLAPASLVPLNVLVNEHRLYLPFAGAVLWFTGLDRTGALRSSAAVWRGLAIALVLFGALTVARNRVWRDERSLWQDAAAKAPQLARPLVYLGNEARDRGDASAAAAYYQEALAREPGNVAALNNLGNAYRQLGQVDRSIATYEGLLATHPELADVRYNLARALQDGGRYGEAARLYRQVPPDSYHYPLALNNLGTLYEKADPPDPVQALYCYGQALARPGRWPDALTNFRRVGESLYRAGRLADIEAICRRLLSEGSQSEARFLLAAVLFGQGRYDDSIAMTRGVLAEQPDFAEGYLQLGRTYEAAGRPAEARRAYESLVARSRDPQLSELASQRLRALEGASR